MDVSSEATALALAQETRARFPYLIHIHNDDYGDFWYANSDKSIDFEGHTYQSACFSLTPPERTTTGISNATLTISAINQEWIYKIRQTQKRSSMEFIAAMVYDSAKTGDVICEPIEENRFTLTSASWNEENITWEAVFDDTMSIQVPCDDGSAQTTPGCV